MKNKARILWLFFLVTLVIQFIGGFLYFVVFDEKSTVQIVYGITKGIMLLAPIILYFAGFKLPKLNFKNNILQSLIYGFFTGFLVSGLIFAVYFIFQSFFEQFGSNILLKVNDFGILSYYWFVAVGVSVFHSLFEEYYWRFYVVRGFDVKFDYKYSILLGNFFFTIHHYVILSQFVPMHLAFFLGTFVGFGGVVWSYIYKKTDSVLGNWISHVIVDFSLFIIGYFLLT